MNDIRSLLIYIQKESPLKLTQAGYLPPTLCKELAENSALKEEDWWYEYRKQKVIRESDFQYINILHISSILFGLVKKRANQLSLTKKGASLLTTNSKIPLYRHTINEYISKLEWGYTDGYPEAAIIQESVLISVFLVQKYGGSPHEARFYSEKFLEILPEAQYPFHNRGIGSSKDSFTNCYLRRVFEHFLKRFNLIRIEKKDSKKDYSELDTITKTPLSDILFIWE